MSTIQGNLQAGLAVFRTEDFIADAKRKLHMLDLLYVSSRKGTSLEKTAWSNRQLDIIRNLSDYTSHYLLRCIIIRQEYMSSNYRMRKFHHAGHETLEKESRRITKCIV